MSETVHPVILRNQYQQERRMVLAVLGSWTQSVHNMHLDLNLMQGDKVEHRPGLLAELSAWPDGTPRASTTLYVAVNTRVPFASLQKAQMTSLALKMAGISNEVIERDTPFLAVDLAQKELADKLTAIWEADIRPWHEQVVERMLAPRESGWTLFAHRIDELLRTVAIVAPDGSDKTPRAAVSAVMSIVFKQAALWGGERGLDTDELAAHFSDACTAVERSGAGIGSEGVASRPDRHPLMRFGGKTPA